MAPTIADITVSAEVSANNLPAVNCREGNLVGLGEDSLL
jgi:hypothetical protein